MSIPNPRPIEPWPVDEKPAEGMIEPWIDAYKIHQDNPKRLLTMTFHAYAKRYEERTFDTKWTGSRVGVPSGTLMFPVSDQARRMKRADGTWGPWVEET